MVTDMKVGQMVEKVFLELARPVSFHSATGEDVRGGGYLMTPNDSHLELFTHTFFHVWRDFLLPEISEWRSHLQV